MPIEDDAIERDTPEDPDETPRGARPEPTDAAPPRPERVPLPTPRRDTGDDKHVPTRLVSDYRDQAEALIAVSPEEKPKPAEKPAEPTEADKLRADVSRLSQKIEELSRSKPATVTETGPGHIPPPDQVDPNDDATVTAIAGRLIAQDPTAIRLVEDYAKAKEQLAPVDKDLNDVTGDIIAVERSLSKGKALGLSELDDDQKELAQSSLEMLRAKRERLLSQKNRLDSQLDSLSDRFDSRKGAWVERVRERADTARRGKLEAESQTVDEARAERLWEGTFDTVVTGVPKDVRDQIEEHLLFKADFILNDMKNEIPDLPAWMKQETQKLLKAWNVTTGLSDVTVSRLREQDKRQSFPRGTASEAKPLVTQRDMTPEERRRAADRRTALLARSVKAVPRA